MNVHRQPRGVTASPGVPTGRALRRPHGTLLLHGSAAGALSMGTSGKEPKQPGKAFPNKRGPARSCHPPLATTAPDPTEPERVSGPGRRGGRLSPLAAPVEKGHPPHPPPEEKAPAPAPASPRWHSGSLTPTPARPRWFRPVAPLPRRPRRPAPRVAAVTGETRRPPPPRLAPPPLCCPMTQLR